MRVLITIHAYVYAFFVGGVVTEGCSACDMHARVYAFSFINPHART